MVVEKELKSNNIFCNNTLKLLHNKNDVRNCYKNDSKIYFNYHETEISKVNFIKRILDFFYIRTIFYDKNLS